MLRPLSKSPSHLLRLKLSSSLLRPVVFSVQHPQTPSPKSLSYLTLTPTRPPHLKYLNLSTRPYATMSQSHACCTVPPVVAEDYKEKGQWLQIAGMKTYATGPKDAKKALLVVYDIFGFFPQTLQGADILAHGDSHQNYQVFMPDFFDGKPAPIDWFPPDTDEKGKKLGEFFQGPAAPPKTLERIPKVLSELQSQRSSISEWGIVGYCWGGKIVNLSSQSGTAFKAAAACHPAMVDAGDAPGVTIPYIMLPSKDEDKNDVKKWQDAVKVKNIVKWYDDQQHGFMAARGDLKDDNVKAKYEDAYKTLLDFFHENM